jgi:putative LysE/RhtB family amino acid efflux pump
MRAGVTAVTSAREGRPIVEYGSAVALTLANPQTILTFAALFAGAGLAAGGSWAAAVATTLGILLGSALWWFGLVSVVAAGRHMLTAKAVTRVSRVAGAAVIGLAVWLVVGAVWALF